ncbi:ankyrin repeat domain-containing protein [Mucisphaera calidilacus]|uniref:Ankyrin repeats (3 copies) n=1 Tax=Mucisphaera calidilacus TaxID=2527982 RepID=A0A518BYG5_9BACT|nr:ankyrin repeat domain-containing protein [Mucisphaera calidilacus]QDU71998.1 Ankyrin repeats (3 copies) [Mucisphaera calidilacus]
MVRPADLFAAIEQNDDSTIRELVAANERVLHTHVGQQRDWGIELCLPLHLAAEVASPQTVALLLDLGAMPDGRTRFETPLHAMRTALHLAASRGDTTIITQLLDAGAEIEVRDADGRSPLTNAAAAGHADALSLLIEREARVDAPDNAARTPLHHAIRALSQGAVAVLLDAGANANHTIPKDPENHTPLHRCVAEGEPALNIARLLLDHGADPAIADPRDQKTALDRATERGIQSFIDLLTR